MPAFCELSQLGVIGFAGEDAQGFLHAQLTCDVAALPVDRSVYGGYCTPKGRMLATFLLWRSADGYFMQLPASLREQIQKRLSMYVLRSKVKVEDAGPRWARAGVFGEGAAACIERIFGEAPKDDHRLVNSTAGTVIRLSADRFEILVPPAHAPATLEKLKDGAESVEPEHWNWLDLRAGVPTITEPTREAFVPQMANLDLIGGLSFSKGCYPGQEIVARMHFLGKLKQRMFLAHLSTGTAAETSPQPGDKLYSADLGSQSSGTVVNAAPAPQGGYDLLAVMQIASAAGHMHWKTPDGPVLELLPLPYEVTGNP